MLQTSLCFINNITVVIFFSDILNFVKTSDDIIDYSENNIKSNSIEDDLEIIADDSGILASDKVADAMKDYLKKNKHRAIIVLIFENPLSDNIVSISKGDFLVSINAYQVV